MSLVFKPKRFRDRSGDVIDAGEMVIKEIRVLDSDTVLMELENGMDNMYVNNIGDMQSYVQYRWNDGGGESVTGAKNLSRSLRDSIRTMECVREGHPDDAPPHLTGCEEKLARLKEELARLEEGAES